MSAAAKLAILKKRAAFLQKARQFFIDRGLLEVDVPILNKFAPIDRHIEVLEIPQVGFLHTSPEYGIKKLLSEVNTDVFQISHVFRKGEKGKNHNPEFTMIEWYRLSVDFFTYIDEVIEFIELFLGSLKTDHITYDQAFKKFANIDSITPISLKSCLDAHEISYTEQVNLLDLVYTHIIEPNLGKEGLTVIYDFPKDQAALAKTYHNGKEEKARRFEIYYKGCELANGYDELGDKTILEKRLKDEAEHYKANFGKTLEIDPDILEAMDGFPECCGVAIGFDRLLMKALNIDSIQKLLP